LAAALYATLGVGFIPHALAQSVTTVPVGAVRISIAGAASEAVPKYTSVSLPLIDNIIYRGRIVGVGASSITVSNSVTESFNLSSPYLLKITSGQHKGRSFVISSNSGSVLNVDNQGTVLNALSPAIATGSDSGDGIVIYPADTINGVFGSAVLGAASASAADQVWIWQPASARYNKYYYNTTNSRWQDADFGSASNNVVIRPDAGVMFMRRAITALDIDLVGEVPVTETRFQIRDSGYTFVSHSFPVSNTLLGLGLHLQQGWVSASSAAQADQVWIWQPASARFNKYYYNTTNARWQDTDFGSASNSVLLNGGVPFMIKRAAESATTYSTFEAQLPNPYSIN
jgi:uncharacterized protein (TIGR02597 family)